MASLIGNERVKGQGYNVASAEITSIVGMVHLVARAMNVQPRIVEIPMALARQQRPALVHWGEALTGTALLSIDKALRDIDWTPRFGIEDGFRDSYAWYDKEGRGRYEYDFAAEDALLAQLT